MADNWLEKLGLSDNELDDLRVLAFSYIRQGHYKTALKIYKGIVILSNKSPEDLETLGALLLEIGEPKEAIDPLEKALKIHKDHLKTRLNYAKALLLSGYRQRGVQECIELMRCKDPAVSLDAEALKLAYS
ncbi:type III secretion chaperone [bacterium]|jgi:tetratricopeptide (TPR) repeat protein|nr:type III secretion chaperone [bacterium]